MLGLLKLCYTCLGMNSKDLIDVASKDFDNLTFLYKLRACVSSHLDEHGSKHICSACAKQLRISYRFKEMVLLSQDTLNKHKNEIVSGTYVAGADSKLSELISGRLFEPECVVVKKEPDSPSNTSRRRRLKARKAVESEVSEEYFAEIPLDNCHGGGDDGGSSDCFLADLKNDVDGDYDKDGVTQVNDCLLHHTKNEGQEEHPQTRYKCTKCHLSMDVPEIRQHLCDVYNSCDNLDTKEEAKRNSKDCPVVSITKARRGRPKKRLKIPKPDLEYECYHCSMIFNKRWKLQKHISRVHSDSKKYVCTYCDKGFKQSYHLREHLTSHTGERNYTCSFCDKSFQRISSMRRHIRSHEAAPGHKTKRTPFLCTVCGKSFPFSNGVQRHMRIHLGIKNHECNICQRRFTQSTHLHVHMRTHTGEKPYVCDTCGEAFSLNASLQKHMSVHQNGNRTSLLMCKKLTMENL